MGDDSQPCLAPSRGKPGGKRPGQVRPGLSVCKEGGCQPGLTMGREKGFPDDDAAGAALGSHLAAEKGISRD